MALPSFDALAAQEDPRLDEFALALAAQFRDVDAQAALSELDRLGDEVADAVGPDARPERQLAALQAVLGRRHGFSGDREQYDDPRNSMLDVVLERRAGLPILLSTVYVEVARRADIELCGVGLPGHYVAGHFGAVPPLLIDPFNGGGPLGLEGSVELRPWGAHETVLRMLNNLVATYERRNDLGRAIRAAELRLELPFEAGADRAALATELRALRARLN